MKKLLVGLTVVSTFLCTKVFGKSIEAELSNLKEENEALLQKVSYLEHEKEELLQKLFENQLNNKKNDSSFEVISALNKIPTDDKITKDCANLLQNLISINVRTDQILKNTEIINQNSDKEYQIASITEELKAMQDIVQKKLKIYSNHEEDLLKTCNKQKESLASHIEQLKNQLSIEQQEYPEMTDLKLYENLMNSISVVKTIRKNKPAAQAKKLKLFEEKLLAYTKLKIQESDFNRLEHKTKDFSDNIVKIKMALSDIAKKNDKLEEKFISEAS